MFTRFFPNRHKLTLFDKINVCLEELGDHVMNYVFQAPGKIDVDRFNKAMRLSLDAEPILKQRLIQNPLSPYWTEWDESTLSAYPFCELEECSNVKESLERFLALEIDYQSEPMIKTKIFRGEIEQVCIKVSCNPIDGRGFVIYVHRLLAIYEALASNPNHKPIVSNIKNRSTKHLIPHFKLRNTPLLLLAAIRNQLTDSFTANNWRYPSIHHSTHNDIDLDIDNNNNNLNHDKNKPPSKAFDFQSLNKETYNKIQRFRKFYNFSFNDVLLGA